ncbi:MAG: zinc ABC transporter substrate-binding protein [Ruminiclostridium sp.]|jgi:zinc transport system substrate-binding protein|nr:zinc ABC transporter substrate-binding protein [Ruminiclostridium sp.]
MTDRKSGIFVLLLTIVLVCGCTAHRAAPAVQGDKITVYTSFYTMYDFAQKIGGDKVNIINMVPSGMEPHDWEPSPKDIAGLSGADLFIYNGAGMEGWADKVLDSIGSSKLIAVETTKDIPMEKATQTHSEHTDEHDEDYNGDFYEGFEYDPHVWLNPMNAKLQMKAIRDGLIQADPRNSSFYQERFEDYSGRLDALDQAYSLAAAGFMKKEIVVSHEAFGYLCHAYGLEQLAIKGISSDSEPTPGRMAEMIDFVREHEVKVIFFEELASPKVAEAIARETGARTMLLNPLEGLSEENLRAGKDYFSVMEENLEALKQALQ